MSACAASPGLLHIVAAPGRVVMIVLCGVLDCLCVRMRQAAAATYLAACAVPADVLGLQPFAERRTQPAYAQLCGFMRVLPVLQAECVYLGCSELLLLLPWPQLTQSHISVACGRCNRLPPADCGAI